MPDSNHSESGNPVFGPIAVYEIMVKAGAIVGLVLSQQVAKEPVSLSEREDHLKETGRQLHR